MGSLDECYINGSMEQRLPGNLNISFAYVEGESLLMALTTLRSPAVRLVRRQLSNRPTYSRVWVRATTWHNSSIRFGIGRFNTEAEVDYVANKLIDVVLRLRELSPLMKWRKKALT